jgi:hypothetical protein
MMSKSTAKYRKGNRYFVYVSEQRMALTVLTFTKIIFLINIIKTYYILTFIQIDGLWD